MQSNWDPYQHLSAEQRERLREFERILLGFNKKINLVSRETEAYFEERHTLHSLVLAQRDFPPGSQVVDWGTGGGLPLIPLAIRFPDVAFCGVDAVEKKLNVVRAAARRLSLENLDVWHGRAEEWPGKADYAVSRATAPLVDLWSWSIRALGRLSTSRFEQAGVWTSDLITLKGGDLGEEIEALKAAYPDVRVDCYPIQPLLGRDYFEEKYVVCVARNAPGLGAVGARRAEQAERGGV